jgi:hypothetical protein
VEEQEFWGLIDETRDGARGPAAHAQRLEERLAQLRAEEIDEFSAIWSSLEARAYHWDLWAAAHVINGGCSDDCFDYFLGYLISLGKERYERALDDPDSLADRDLAPAGDWEEIRHAAARAYEKVADKEMPAVDGRRPKPDEPAGEEWDEDNVEERVPRLAEKYSKEAETEAEDDD